MRKTWWGRLLACGLLLLLLVSCGSVRGPGAEQPGPEQPGPEQPGPEQPDPEQPDPEEPDPGEPGPEEPDPEEPDPEEPTWVVRFDLGGAAGLALHAGDSGSV